MSTRRAQSMPPAAFEKKERSRCTAAICMSWKVFTCIFSHVMLVTLVVAYCIFGAITFEYLEAKNEIEVKEGIRFIRGNLTESIWKMTYEEVSVLHENNWTQSVVNKLQGFENDIINSMKTKGWDGNEDIKKIQWTFSGALFYSIIVITTIGYGHIAPKTYMGKISTIFYAILGIPLMLLCLSNIGDIMATSFRFLYWRVCCYVCTREPKRNTRRQRRMDMGRQPMRYSNRSTNPQFRRSMRVSQRTNDSGGLDYYNDPSLMHAYSDTDLRQIKYNSGIETNLYQDWSSRDRNFNNRGAQNKNQRNSRSKNRDIYRDRHTVERERYNYKSDPERVPDDAYMPSVRNRSNKYGRSHSIARETPSKGGTEITKYPDSSLPSSFGRNKTRSQVNARAQSLDPRMRRELPIEFDNNDPPCRTPVLCNKYAIDIPDSVLDEKRGNHHQSQSLAVNTHNRHGGSSSRGRNDTVNRKYEPPLRPSPPPPPPPPNRYNRYSPEEEFDLQPIRKNRRREKYVPPPHPSPRIMSPMGFAVHRQARLTAYPDDDSMYGDDGDYASDLPARVKPVPIWLCVFLVVSYIIAGAFLFSNWEGWSFLDSAYFCFITLTTIGFGDFVPAQGVKENPEISIALCSLYLLFGIALLAMSFNLVQEEVITNVKSVARRLGILKEEEVDY